MLGGSWGAVLCVVIKTNAFDGAGAFEIHGQQGYGPCLWLKINPAGVAQV